jgi:hypothetical protein
LQGGEDIVVEELFAQVKDIALACPRRQCLLFQTINFIGLPQVGAKADDFAVVVIF